MNPVSSTDVFKCASGRCVYSDQVCDGMSECDDGSYVAMLLWTWLLEPIDQPVAGLPPWTPIEPPAPEPAPAAEAPASAPRPKPHSAESNTCPTWGDGLTRRTRRDPEASWLYQVVARCEPVDGEGQVRRHMPYNAPTLLPDGSVALIPAWIAGGAAAD